MGKILSIVNQKGGVGKTTTAINLASFLARFGKKVLLVDLDPQGNATSGLGIDKHTLEKSTYHLLIELAQVKEVLLPTGRGKLELLPSNIHLAGAELELVALENREFLLKQALLSVKNQYDFILIDCPPSLSLLTLNALVASDGMIITTQAEYYALEGLTQLVSTIEIVTQKMNPQLKIFGLLLTMYDQRMSLAQQVEREVRQHFGEKVFQINIPRNVRLSEAPSHGLNIAEYDSKSKGAEAYHQLAKEVLKRAKTF